MNIDKAFGIHDDALLLRSRRAQLLADNLANAETPGYKARDLDFRAVLGGAMQDPVRLAATRPGHMGGEGRGMSEADLLYRQPVQPSLDGNTVDTEVEQAQFMQNSIQYEASLRFLSGRISGLITAIKGE